MLIYISGAITGDSQYKAKFQKAKKELEAKGHSVINPAEFDLPEGASWEDYMKRDLAWLCGCDGIYMLKDWRQSRGAKLEHDLAQTLKMQVRYEPLKVEACKICDNNCGYCKYACNCSTEVDA